MTETGDKGRNIDTEYKERQKVDTDLQPALSVKD